MKTKTKLSLFNNQKNRLTGFISKYIIKYSLLSIVVIYNTVILITSATLYKLIPILLGYEKHVKENSRKIGFSYDMQFIVATIAVIGLTTIVIIVLFRDINKYKLLSLDDKNSANIKSIRKKCMNLPYIIYVVQITIPAAVAFLTGLTGFFLLGYSYIIVLEVTGVVFSFCFLSAIITHTFSRHIYSSILYDTYMGQEIEGFRVNIRTKILLQIIPMIITSIIIISLLGYSKLIDEKGSLLQESFRIKVDDILKNSGDIKSSSHLFEALKDVKFQGIENSCFVVEANGQIITSDNTTYPDYLINLIKEPIDGYKVYGYTLETQGIVKSVSINGDKVAAGVIFHVESPDTVKALLIALVFMLLVSVLVIYFFSDTISKDVSQVADSLMKIGKIKSIRDRKDIPVVSNDEIGDLVNAFNNIQHIAAEQDEMKNEFFANISHELRTPLNIILSSIQLLLLKEKKHKDDNFAEEIAKTSQMIKQNSYRLLRLVNNLIDSSKISTSFYELNMKNYNIVNVVEEISLSVANYIKEKNIDFIFDTDVEERIMACDADMIERIMLNLFSNAVKFTEPGGNILVKVHEVDNNIVISVKDSGIGMSEKEQKVIFERFKQVDKSHARKRQGSGIGLWLVKLLVEMHEGSIAVKSETGKGTEFIITLPIITVKEQEDLDCLEKHACTEKAENNFEKVKIEFSDIYF
ncbi:HAMP domain-containing histidine kinase [Clostridium swellfunianum]|uniref:sensor histidine kinase n=1 Tax=Clostridium swellfunianum TaxID=1367462 RepID=UPI00202E1C86|nr:HAMP domain-containing sensor histidine kinase [Clostridium swellfunianum]MCM0648074.1 HAMP domain-containing histidine kinase [Clostridium swellfunianum]